jgi:hypothetical protein
MNTFVFIPKGGYVRSTPINLDIALDASISRDDDISPTSILVSTLTYSWTCTIASIVDFGTECKLFGAVTTRQTPIIVITANSMTFNVTYALEVVVTAADGRSAAQIVTLSPTYINSPEVSITSTFVKFNAGIFMCICIDIYMYIFLYLYIYVYIYIYM